MTKDGVKIFRCKDKIEASRKALEFLLQTVSSDTLLLLSGGTSPDLLYRLIAKSKSLKPGAVALVDERFGQPMHPNSNERMITETGLVGYLNNEGIPFYKILKEGSMETATVQYEETIRNLFDKFPKKVAIMGIGADGHTAGIKPGLDYDHAKLVVSYDDKNGSFGKRITLTFDALSQIDEFIILVFGEEKREALEKMLQEQGQNKLPAVFYKKFPGKVIILTDIAKIY